MTLALRYAVRSDVGLLREGNEDSAYAGPHLLAVADGMGGHAAGEVASAATITTIASLDGEVSGADLRDALADAVAAANLRLHELISNDPAIEGMGTTLTALLWSDGYAALGHIGDSRAYLLRDGSLHQITHDHSLVQSLVDEGKISEDDVATHPHRSLLLRALDGRTVAEPDLTVIESLPGDRYLLCSDGLSGVVTEQTLRQTLSSAGDPDRAALQLIELAIRGGGPDNITCIVADVLDLQISALAPTWNPIMAGAAANGAPGGPPRQVSLQSSPATRARRLTRTAPQPTTPNEAQTGMWRTGGHDAYTTGAFETVEDRDYGARQAGGSNGGGGYGGPRTAPFERPAFDGPDGDSDDEIGTGGRRRGRRGNDGYDDEDDFEPRRRRRWPIVTVALVVLIILLGGGAYGAWWYNQQQYYVGLQGQDVAIYRGTDQSLAGINLSSVVSTSSVQFSQLSSSDQANVQQTISQGSLGDAQSLVSSLQAEVGKCQSAWESLASWYAADVTYTKAVAAAAKSKAKVTAAKPGQEPAYPDQADCAPASAFGISSSQLPPTTTPASTTPATIVTPTATTGSTASATPAASAKASA